MLIVCPSCVSSYEVAASSIGAAGRSVRCVRCRTIWFQQPQADVPPLAMEPAPAAAASDATIAAFRSELGNAAADAPSPDASPLADGQAPPGAGPPPSGEPAPPSLNDLMGTPGTPPAEGPASANDPSGPALSEISIPAGEAPPVAPALGGTEPGAGEQSSSDGGGDIESVVARRGKKRGNARRRIPMRSGRVPAVILVLAGVVAALIGWRGTIVRHAPQTASLYAAIGLPVNLRGLSFTEVQVSRDTHDGVPVLVVEGTIVSAASKPVEVPRLRFAMRNEAGGEVYAWTAMPAREVLGPGEALPFRSRLASPPSEGRDVMVRFFNRLDAASGLR